VRSIFAGLRRNSPVKAANRLVVSAVLACAFSTLAQANVPTPLARPAPPPPSILLSDADGRAFWDGLDARQKGKWGDVRALSRRIADPTAKGILDWLRFQKEGTGSTVAEIVAFQQAHPRWPRQNLLSRRAEDALTDYPMADQDVIAWFATRDPLTGEGKIRLGEAFLNSGRTDEGANWIQQAWVEHQFSRAREAEILRKHARHLSSQAHEDRLNRLIWEQRFADGRRMLQLVNAQARAVADARLKLSSRSRGAESALARVPAHLRADTGLLFDHARYLRRRGQNETAIPLFITSPSAPDDIGNPGRWWTERKILARKALAEGQYQEAYYLATGHGHDAGVAFAEGEFLAGWIALQYLNNPDTAFQHFQTLEAGVKTPISRARGAYWMGRAAEAAGRQSDAMAYFTKASLHATTFYGQLAIARISTNGQPLIQLSNDPVPTSVETSALANNDMVRAFELLNEAGEKALARSFMIELAKTLPDAATLAALADLMVERGHPNLSVRVAKVAAGRGILLAERSYPTEVLPNYRQVGTPVERAFVYGLSRQESEFDPDVVSHAGARGLMQLMPRTARAVARGIGVPYRRSRLTSDPGYNAMLGSAHLGDLLDDFAGSYIMTIAAYNAGAHRVSQWIEAYGDPRSPAVDPIDWMENIPFTETRNYVQRVMENIQVYRARLANQTASLRIEQDIARYDGSSPIINIAPKPQAVLTAPPVATTPVAPAAAPLLAVPAATTVANLPQTSPPTPPNADLPRPNPNRPVIATPAPRAAEPTPVLATAPVISAPAAPTFPATELSNLNAPPDATTNQLAPFVAEQTPVNTDGSMKPVVDSADIAARAARQASIPAATATAPVSAPSLTPLLEELAPVPVELVAPPIENRAPAAPAITPLAIARDPTPVHLTPPAILISPSNLDRPRAPAAYSDTSPDLPAVTPEPGTMLPIFDEG